MIIFLFGPDVYRSRQKLREIVEDYKKANPNWLDFVKIDSGDKEINILEKLHQSINTVSMFNEKKLILIESVFSLLQEDQDKLLEFLKQRKTDEDKDVSIVFWVEEAQPENELFKFFKKSAIVHKFIPFQRHELREWIKKYVGAQGRNIDNQAIEKLINYIGSNLWRMSNELDKLISFAQQRIEKEDVEELVKPEIDSNIFNTIDALGQRDKKQALRLFRQHLLQGDSEGYLLNRFIYQFRNLLKIRDLLDRREPIKKASLHPFVAQKTSSQARNFSLGSLKKIYHKLLEIDLDIKLGKTDARTALELFIVGL